MGLLAEATLINISIMKEDKFKYLREDRLDFLGNKIVVGDDIVVINPWYRDLVRAKIIKITPKMITVKLNDRNGTTTRYSEQTVKIIKDGKKGK